MRALKLKVERNIIMKKRIKKLLSGALIGNYLTNGLRMYNIGRINCPA
jgi:hypothetical protein